MSATETVRRAVEKATAGLGKEQKAKYVMDLIAKFSPGTQRVPAGRFCKALERLGVSKEVAKAAFEELDVGGRGFLDIEDASDALSVPLPVVVPGAPKPPGSRFKPGAPESARSSSTLSSAAQREIGNFWEKIGARVYEKAFKSERQLMLALDKDNSGMLDRTEVARFLGNYLSLSKEESDRFFNLLDVDHNGLVSTQEVVRRLAMFLETGVSRFFGEKVQVDKWHEEGAHDRHKQAMPPGGTQPAGMGSAPSARSSRSSGAGSRPSNRSRSLADLSQGQSPTSPMAGQMGATMYPGMGARPGSATPSRASLASLGNSGLGPSPLASSRRSSSIAGAWGKAGGGLGGGLESTLAPDSTQASFANGASLTLSAPMTPTGSLPPPPAALARGPPAPVDFSAAILAQLRRSLADRCGLQALQALTFALRGRQQLTAQDLKAALAALGLSLDAATADLVLASAGGGRATGVSGDRLLEVLRGPVDERRERAVAVMFAALDAGNKGALSTGDIASTFDPSFHPDVWSGRLQASQGLQDFLNQLGAGVASGGRVTRAAFLEYYRNLSAAVDSDERFDRLLSGAWRLPGGSANASARSPGSLASSRAGTGTRLLVTFMNGTQETVALERDLTAAEFRNEASVRRQLERQTQRPVRAFALSE